MDLSVLLFLSSGLFLGWSLGANDAANVFGTAVGSRMVRFTTAAVLFGVFVVLGAVWGGAGTTHGLGQLGTVNALPGSFMVALSAALTVYWMTRLGLPVSTSQAVVGAIVGWNIFSGFPTNLTALGRIAGTWVACPILAAVFAATLYFTGMFLLRRARIHLLWLDLFNRVGLVVAGAFGAYALGANNIANVMGAFVVSTPFKNIDVLGWFVLTPAEQLFFLGGLAIAVGAFYSRRVMMTVGRSLLPVRPAAAWVVVVSQGLVLFVFSSVWLQRFLVEHGLPQIPLVPVSSSQAVVGAILGIGLVHGLKGARQIRWSMLAQIASGWVSTPLIAAVVCYVMLFFLQNVFQQQVYRPVHYELDGPSLAHLRKSGTPVGRFRSLNGMRVTMGTPFRNKLRERILLPRKQEDLVLAVAELYPTRIDAEHVKLLDPSTLSPEQIQVIGGLIRKTFRHRWELAEALAQGHPDWKFRTGDRPADRLHNTRLKKQLDYVARTFRVSCAVGPSALRAR